MSVNKTLLILSACIVIFAASGCQNQPSPADAKTQTPISIDTTIGSVADVFAFGPIAIEGYSLVGGLSRTGSTQCPPSLRKYLKQYILQELSEKTTNVDQLIDSPNTAVVHLEAVIPPAVSRNQRFDVRVSAMEGTRTSSIRNGRLYGAELRAVSGLGIASRILARAEGPVFIDTLDHRPEGSELMSGYVLGGGVVINALPVNVTPYRPDYKLASVIRNKLNERFGGGTARAFSPGLVEVKVPPAYKFQKERFISLVKATHLYDAQTGEYEKYIATLAARLNSAGAIDAEIGLEAIGRRSLDSLSEVMETGGPEAQLRAARCILNLGSDLSLNRLRDMAFDRSSPYRIDALKAVTNSAAHNDAASLARALLRDDDFDIRLAAYEQLHQMDDMAIRRIVIARSFELQYVTQTEHAGIFVARSGPPRIVLFGGPIYCRDDMFIRSDDGTVTINASPGQDKATLARQIADQPNVGPMQLVSSLKLDDIIKGLCEETIVSRGAARRPGLEVPYSEAVAILKAMCDKGAVSAAFRAGELPKAPGMLKEPPPTGR